MPKKKTEPELPDHIKAFFCFVDRGNICWVYVPIWVHVEDIGTLIAHFKIEGEKT